MGTSCFVPAPLPVISEYSPTLPVTSLGEKSCFRYYCCISCRGGYVTQARKSESFYRVFYSKIRKESFFHYKL